MYDISAVISIKPIPKILGGYTREEHKPEEPTQLDITTALLARLSDLVITFSEISVGGWYDWDSWLELKTKAFRD